MTATLPLAEITPTTTGLVVTQGPVQAHLNRAEIASILVRQRHAGGLVAIKGLTLTGAQVAGLHQTMRTTPRRFQWSRHV